MTDHRVSHVLYLSDLPGRLPFSGAERHVLVLLRELALDGVDVELIAMLWGGPDYDRVQVALDEAARAGVTVTVVAKRETSGGLAQRVAMIRAWWGLLRLLRARRDRVVHVHLDLRVTPVLAWVAGIRRIVISVHNDEPVYASKAWRLWWRVLRLLPARLIAITQHVNDYVSRASDWPADRITTVYYGVEPERAAPATRAELGIPEGAFVVGFVGRLTPQKNIPVLLEALAARPDIVGVIVGDGPLRDTLRAQAPPTVRFLGAVPDAARLMPAFDVFCLPSAWEGLGLVLVEAMLHRVPIVASDRGAIPEGLDGGRAGVVCEPTAESIGAGIDAVRARLLAVDEQVERAFERASDVFSVPAMIESTKAVYSSTSAGTP